MSVDYTTILNSIKTSLDNIYSVLSNPVGSDGITQKLDQILVKLNTPVTPVTPTETPEIIDYTPLLTDILARLDFLQTASLWVIGIGTASIVLFILYRVLSSFIDF